MSAFLKRQKSGGGVRQLCHNLVLLQDGLESDSKMKLLLIIFVLEVFCQTIPNKIGSLDRRGKTSKKSSKKNKKEAKNKKKDTYNNYAPKPSIPFAPEPVYNYPKPEPTPKLNTDPAASRLLGVSLKTIKFKLKNLSAGTATLQLWKNVSESACTKSVHITPNRV